MSLWDKRKNSEKKRMPPHSTISISPPQTEFGLCRLGKTDFQDKAEFIMFARMSPELPADFCRREGELQVDMRIYAEELQLIGIEPNTEEFTRAMARIAKELPAA